MYLKVEASGLDQIAQLVGASSQYIKVSGLIPDQDTYEKQLVTV